MLCHDPSSRCAAAREPMRSVPHVKCRHRCIPNLANGKVSSCLSHDSPPLDHEMADDRRHLRVSRCRESRSSLRHHASVRHRRHRPTYRHTRSRLGGDDGGKMGHTSHSGSDDARVCRFRPSPTRGLHPSSCRSRCSSSSPTKSSEGSPSLSSTRGRRLKPSRPSRSTTVRAPLLHV